MFLGHASESKRNSGSESVNGKKIYVLKKRDKQGRFNDIFQYEKKIDVFLKNTPSSQFLNQF